MWAAHRRASRSAGTTPPAKLTCRHRPGRHRQRAISATRLTPTERCRSEPGRTRTKQNSIQLAWLANGAPALSDVAPASRHSMLALPVRAGILPSSSTIPPPEPAANSNTPPAPAIRWRSRRAYSKCHIPENPTTDWSQTTTALRRQSRGGEVQSVCDRRRTWWGGRNLGREIISSLLLSRGC